MPRAGGRPRAPAVVPPMATSHTQAGPSTPIARIPRPIAAPAFKSFIQMLAVSANHSKVSRIRFFRLNAESGRPAPRTCCGTPYGHLPYPGWTEHPYRKNTSAHRRTRFQIVYSNVGRIGQPFKSFSHSILPAECRERAAGPAHLLWYPLWPPPIPRLDRAPLSQEYFSVPDNYLGPKKPIGITILPQCPISGQFFHSPWRLLMVLGFDSLRI